MNDRDGFAFTILFLFQCSMMTAFRFWRVGDLEGGSISALIAGICVLILLSVPDELDNEEGKQTERLAG